MAAGVHGLEGEPLRLLADGDAIPIRLASQGGYAMYLGPRVAGLEPGLAEVRADLVNPVTQEVFVTDTRVIELRAVADGSGWLEPDSRSNSQFSHLVVCPNYGERRVHELDWTLSLEVTDADAQTHHGSVRLRVIPTCAPGSRYEVCVCECEPGYVFGKCGAPH